MKTYSIGRSNDNDLVVRDQSVSRHHAELRVDEAGRYQLVDLNSTNGTFLRDGEQWVQVYDAEVSDNERIMFGGTTTTVAAMLGKVEVGSDGTLGSTGGSKGGPKDAPPEAPAAPPQYRAAEDNGAGAPDPQPLPPAPEETVGQAAPAAASTHTGSYADFVHEKTGGGNENGAVPKAAPMPASEVGKARRRRPPWVVWAGAGAAVVLLAGAGTFAAVEFAGDVFGSSSSQVASRPTGSGDGGGGNPGGGTGGTGGTTGPKAGAPDTTKPPAPPAPAGTWHKVLGGPEVDRATTIQVAADGGYIIAGYTDSKGAGGLDGWVAKLDQSGKVVWQKTYGGKNDDRINTLYRTVDGSLIAAGSTRSKGKGGWDYWVMRLDPNGDVLWERTYGGVKDDHARGIVALRDSGFIIAGDSVSRTPPPKKRKRQVRKSNNNKKSRRTEQRAAPEIQRGWLVNIDKNGKVRWQRTFGTRGSYTVNAIQQTAKGGYVVVGALKRGKGGSDLWAAKLSSKGKMAWERTFGGRRIEAAHAVIATRDRGFVIAGETASRGYGKSDAYLLKLDDKGKRRWARVYGGRQADAALGLTPAYGGGYLLAGFTESKGKGGRDLWIAKVTRSGSKRWERTLGGVGAEWGVGLLSLRAGGIVVAGTTDTTGPGKENVWVVKMTGEGRAGPMPAGAKATSGPAGKSGGSDDKKADAKPSTGSASKASTEKKPSETN